MQLGSPQEGLELLRSLGAAPWLIRHHELVVEAAGLLVTGLRGVRFDRGAQSGTLEDHLVALADKLWKGKRDEALERSVVDLIAATSGEQSWQVFERVDAVCDAIAADGDERLARSAKDLAYE